MKITALFKPVTTIIKNAQQIAYRSNNSILLHTYWEIGKLIVEEEQVGQRKSSTMVSHFKKLK